MSLIFWKDEFALGIKEIDEQHKNILALINKLYDLFDSKKFKEQTEVDGIIKELSDYAIYHFETEEKYFELFGYEKTNEHIEVHNQYRTRIEEWRKRYNESKDEKIFFEISTFLHDWWVWHINNTDREYVPFLKANGVN